MKQLEVTIMGQNYILGCPEGGESWLLDAVDRVDREMTAIRQAGKVKARERIAVLAALNLAYRLAEAPRAAAAPAPTADAGEPRAHVEHAEASEARRAAAAQVEMLISRLDTALNEDGRLL